LATGCSTHLSVVSSICSSGCWRAQNTDLGLIRLSRRISVREHCRKAVPNSNIKIGQPFGLMIFIHSSRDTTDGNPRAGMLRHRWAGGVGPVVSIAAIERFECCDLSATWINLQSEPSCRFSTAFAASTHAQVPLSCISQTHQGNSKRPRPESDHFHRMDRAPSILPYVFGQPFISSTIGPPRAFQPSASEPEALARALRVLASPGGPRLAPSASRTKNRQVFQKRDPPQFAHRKLHGRSHLHLFAVL